MIASSVVRRRALVAAAASGCMLFSAFCAHAEPVKLPAGTEIPLTLEHHVTSGYIRADEPVFFRVTHDVQVDGRTVIARATLVRGKMFDAANRGMVGQSGMMSFGVKSLPAVDGSMAPVDADMTSKGRSRAGATLGWTIFWGIPGLITKGVNPYLERGTEIAATVAVDTLVDPDKTPGLVEASGSDGTHVAAAAGPPEPLPVAVYKNRIAGSARKP